MRNDVIANYVAQLINIFLRFFLVPIYLSNLGVSAYGIIGFYFSIESIMVLVDFGLGVSSAKLLAEKLEIEPINTIRVIRSVELIYLVISLGIGVLLFTMSEFISNAWLTIDNQSINGIHVLSLMALLLVVGWPKSLYENFLIGQKKIIQKNIVGISINIVRAFVMIYFINVLNGKIETYFWVMIISVFVETFLYRVLAYKSLTISSSYAGFKELKPFLKFTSGVGFFSILSLVIFQADRVFISKFLTTTDLGLYNLSAVIPLAIFSLIYPITSAAFPRLVRIEENDLGLTVYNKWSLLLGILCTSYFALISTNFPFLINIWLQGESEKVNLFVANALLAGVFCHSFTNLNINLFISNGRSKIVSSIYLFSGIAYVVFLFFIIGYSVNYVAVGWVVCNTSLLIGTMFFLHKYYKRPFKIFIQNLTQLVIILSIYFVVFFFCIENFLSNGLVRLLLSILVLTVLLYIFFRNKISLFKLSD